MSVGGIIGAAIGFAIGGPAGALKGFSYGTLAGSILLPGSVKQEGPRLSDLTPQTSEYGKPIPIVYGTVGIGGNVIWASDIVEVATTTKQGGKGGPSVSTTTFSYFGNFAIALAEGERDIGKMWAGPEKRLIWDTITLEGSGSVRLYTGTESQLPDALIESYLGAGNVPAYRGLAYVVFEMFPLEKDGNRIPFITAEVGSISGVISRAPVYLGASAASPKAVVDPNTGLIWSLTPPGFSSTANLTVNDDATATQLASFSIALGFTFIEGCIAYVPYNGITNWPTILTELTYGAPVNLIVVTGQKFVGIDCFLLFNADNHTYIGAIERAYSGTANLLNLIYNPVRMETVGFRYGHTYVTNPIDPAVSVEASLGGSGGLAVGAALLAGNYFAVYMGDVGVGELVLRRLDTYAAYAVIVVPIVQQGQAFYDSTRNKLISIAAGTSTVYVVDVATATVSSFTLASAPDADTSPAPSLSLKSCTYARGKYVFGANGNTPNGTTLHIVNPATLATEKTFTYEAYAVNQLINPLLTPATSKPYVFSFDAGNVKRLYFKGVDLGGQPLSEVVADLSGKAKLSAGQYDVAALVDTVEGYAIARQTTVRAAIDALRPAYYFDAVERAAQVVFIKRGGAVAVVIPDTDLAAGDRQAADDDLFRTRQMEVELPRSLNVTYLSRATDYESAAKLSKRLIGNSVNESTLDLPLVLSDTQAQQVADVNLHVAYVQRLTYQFALPRKYSYLEPTDIVVVKGHTMLINKISASPGGVLTVEAVSDDSSYYTPNAIVTETPTSGKLVYVPSVSRLELM